MLKRVAYIVCLLVALEGLSRQGDSDSLQSVLDTATTKISKVEALLSLYDHYVDINPDQAIEWAKIALILSGEIDNSSLLAWSHHKLGNAYRLKGNLLNSLLHISESLSISEANNDSMLIALNLENLGNVYWMAGEHIDAIDYYQQALVYFEGTSDNEWLFNLNKCIGRAYLDHDELDSASKYLGIAYQKMNDNTTHHRPIILGSLSELAYKMEDYEAAYGLIERCKEIGFETNDQEKMVLTYQLEAEIELKRNNSIKALELANTAYTLSEDIGFKSRYKSAQTLSNAYHASNDFENAYEYQQEALSYQDSLRNSEIKSKLAIYNLKTHQVEIELLKQESELSVEQARNNKNIILALVITLGLFLVLIYVTYRGRQLKSKANKILVKKNQMIETQSKQLQRLSDFKSKVFGVVSHDLRSPFQVLHGLVEMLGKDLISKDELKLLLPEIRYKMNNLESLMENLLQWGRTSMEGDTIMKSDFKVIEILDEALESLNNLVTEKDIDIISELDPEIMVNSDKRLICIVVRNLLNNAIKFSKESSQIVVSSHENNGLVGISINDQGIGMNDEQLSKLFTHNTTNSVGTSGERGSGLGLILCQDFIHKLGGEIWVESRPGKGSTFSFSLPKAS